MLWEPSCRLPWKLRSCGGKNICWDGRAPDQIQLSPGKAYAVQYTLNICAAPPAEGKILLRQSPCGGFTDTLPLCFPPGRLRQTLHHVSVLHPCGNDGGGAALSLLLDAKGPVCVERAVMDVVEL